MPSDYLREADGTVQQIVATTDSTVRFSGRSHGRDDRPPGLLVAFTIAWNQHRIRR